MNKSKKWIEPQVESHLFECTCSSDSHNLIIRYCNDPDDFGPELNFSYQLIQFRPFLKRVWAAIKYSFNYRNKSSHWDYISIKEEDLPKLIAIFTKAQKDWQRAGVQWENKCRNTVYVEPKRNLIYKIGDKISDFGDWIRQWSNWSI